MTKEFRSSKFERDRFAPAILSGHSDFVIRASFGLRHSSFGFGLSRHSSLVIHPRGDAKRIEAPFGALHAANGQRHSNAAVPRRQVTAFSGFADGFPLAAIRTHGELETIAAGGRHAQIDARPDDTAQFGHGFMMAFFALPHDDFAFADRHPKRVLGIAEGAQTGKSAQLQAARV